MCIEFLKKKLANIRGFIQGSRHNGDKSSSKKANSLIVEEIIPPELKKAKLKKYHVSQNKDKDAESFMKWRVRKEKSDKTIKYFDTQKLAIEYAQDLADRTGTTVVIHSLDGSIRKQDYSKKGQSKE